MLQCVCVMDKGNYEHDELTGLNIAFTGYCMHAFKMFYLIKLRILSLQS